MPDNQDNTFKQLQEQLDDFIHTSEENAAKQQETHRISVKKAMQLNSNDNEAIDELINRELARRYMYHFFKESWKIAEPVSPYVDNWHIQFICELLQVEAERVNEGIPKYEQYNITRDGLLFFPKGMKWESRDIVINLAFRSTKSLITSVCFPAWAWLLNPSFRFITASYKDDLAIKSAVMSRNIIGSEYYQQLCNHRVMLSSDQNEKFRYQNTESGFRFSTSVIGGGVTGEGCNFLLIDDPIAPSQATSTKYLNRVNNTYKDTFYSRLNQPNVDLRLIIMQRVHSGDLSGKWKDNPTVRHINLPVQIDIGNADSYNQVRPAYLRKFYDSEGLFWPARWSTKQLRAFRDAQGSETYKTQMLQSPEDASRGMMLHAEWWKYYDAEDTPKDAIWHFVIDGAFTENSKNDPSGLMSYSYYNGRWYIRAVDWVHMALPDLVAHVERFAYANGYTANSFIGIEPAGSGLALIASLQSMKPYLNVGNLPAPLRDKENRVRAVTPALEAGRFLLKTGAKWVDKFIEECKEFPGGAHDEAPDLLAMAFDRHKSDYESEGNMYIDLEDGIDMPDDMRNDVFGSGSAYNTWGRYSSYQKGGYQQPGDDLDDYSLL